MCALFLTLWAIRRSKGFIKARTVQEQTAVRDATMSRTTRTIVIISVVFLICNITFAVFGAVMWVYTKIKKVENVKGNSFFLALFFFSHYTEYVFNTYLIRIMSQKYVRSKIFVVVEGRHWSHLIDIKPQKIRPQPRTVKDSITVCAR
eukprot:sb/3473684/